MINQTTKLGEILIDEGIINQSQLDNILDLQQVDNRKLGELLIEKGLIDDHTLTKKLAQLFDLPFRDLIGIKVDEHVLELIPYELMRAHKVFPIELDGQYLTVAMNNPLDVQSIQEFQVRCGYLVKPVMARLHEIENSIREYGESVNQFEGINPQAYDEAEEAPIVELVDSIIKKAIKQKVSDIHFEPHKNKLRVRFRIDGVLYEQKPIEKNLERNVISRIKIISSMDVAENRRPQDGRSSIAYGHNHYDLRISTLPNSIGENLVIRILSKEFAKSSLESLGLNHEEMQIVERLIKKPYGLILVTGPTGAGKTTSLYSMLTKLNQVSKNIISVEDPIEYELEGVNQTAVNQRLGYTFASSMRNILRHDPDIIMVGEIRDVETAETSIRAALTGHLVLSTVHTNTAAGAITRLLEMDIEPFLVSSAIVGVIAQRLIRKLCPHCKSEYTPDEKVIDSLTKYTKVDKNMKFARAGKCAHCFETGFEGREGVFEILEINDAIRSLILKSSSEMEIEQMAVSQGMKTLKVAGIKKIIDQKTSVEELASITAG